ncbi:hypothetical protein BEH94_05615 [Candidatus Altiarchaeales archaeon WOR_SM1_SCG]|nr:hypothetical protein BEH94_05615 [Candidatus Altiarchaeales archaeon WOR_SM1_SCG]
MLLLQKIIILLFSAAGEVINMKYKNKLTGLAVAFCLILLAGSVSAVKLNSHTDYQSRALIKEINDPLSCGLCKSHFTFINTGHLQRVNA